MHTLSSGSATRTLRRCAAEETQDLHSRQPPSCARQARAAPSAAATGTMPQRTQHPLVHVLLFWITILTVVQVVFVALFFTNGHTSQNTKAVQADLNKQTQANNASSLSDHGTVLGQMLSFRAKPGTAVRNITWISTNGPQDLVLPQKNVLTLQADGYYFLNLQVTVYSFNPRAPLTVRLLRNGRKVLLEGPINPHTNSTGLLGKAEELTAQTELSVSIDPQAVNVNDSASVTHLDIVYMHKPRNNQS
ncbi:uncharacterized protein LOC114861100 [Betta splendens]|uniref:Uncharacterized protein LOC114861100 n=1 Tax=Betta splendens TaxID=158456 RepID=A0A6P7N942_BETSP|nr:uncharacterized protein LOC114861100 [Betta splendens]